jgi:endonuclease/exonuclease/phosphatase family metal-dependent hydrolase
MPSYWIKFILLCITLPFGVSAIHAGQFRIVSYNTENLFHPEHDSLKDDYEWTAEGERRWSYTRYYRKVENIARVLTNIGEWEGADIIGLQEVENASCLYQLCRTLGRSEYAFVHYESPDRRGIDVALLYKKSRVDTLCTRAIKIDLGESSTRDILYVCAQIDTGDTLHFLVCHLPSQRGGAAESAWKRAAAKERLQVAVDSLLLAQPHARVIVMGDMNSSPKDDIRGLHNKMLPFAERGVGTHKYQGQWTCLDQFYTSEVLDSVAQVSIYDAQWIQESDEKYLGLRPKRTYLGFRYQNGFSDHLPIVMDIVLPNRTPHKQ